MSEELRKRAEKYRGVDGAGTSGEEDTFASLLTGRRSLDLKFSTPLARDRFLSAFKTFAWETDTSTASAKKPVQVLRHYAKTGLMGEPDARGSEAVVHKRVGRRGEGGGGEGGWSGPSFRRNDVP